MTMLRYAVLTTSRTRKRGAVPFLVGAFSGEGTMVCGTQPYGDYHNVCYTMERQMENVGEHILVYKYMDNMYEYVTYSGTQRPLKVSSLMLTKSFIYF